MYRWMLEKKIKNIEKGKSYSNIRAIPLGLIVAFTFLTFYLELSNSIFYIAIMTILIISSAVLVFLYKKNLISLLRLAMLSAGIVGSLVLLYVYLFPI